MSEISHKFSGMSHSAAQAWKLVIIGVIILVLMIPVAWLSNLIRERYERRNSVIGEIAEKWGGKQTLCGPVISVPYRTIITQTDAAGISKTAVQKAYLHIAPKDLNITGKIKTESHRRGIFSVTGYKTELSLSADFPADTIDVDIPDGAELEWQNAILSFDLTDRNGLKSLQGNFDGKPLTFYQSSGAVTVSNTNESKPLNPRNLSYTPEVKETEEFSLKFEAKLPGVNQRKSSRVQLQIILTGTQKLSFLTSGISETVSLSGDWASPSFTGDLLPESRTVDNNGFTAAWHTNYLTTGNKQFWLSEGGSIKLATLGVDFLIMVDSYQQSTRTLKYSVLFLLLTFLTFFFAETVAKQRIHPIQYLMVGCSIIIFYLLLLSISEHIAFGWAYLIAASGVVLQVSLYCYSILKTRKFALQVGSLLTALYIFLYLLLRLEDSALLIGSISLFVLLGIAMYVIRNVNWYAQDEG